MEKEKSCTSGNSIFFFLHLAFRSQLSVTAWAVGVLPSEREDAGMVGREKSGFQDFEISGVGR